MPRLLPRSVACATVLTLLAPMSASADTTSTAVSAISSRLAAPASTAARPAHPLLLVNGDLAVVRSQAGVTGTAVLRPTAAAGPASPVLLMRASGSTELVPADALPYLGHGLADSLFQVPALARAERGGRLPVTIGYATRAHPVPGLTVTHRGTGTETGYFTAASAARFGVALLRQFRSDHATGGYGRDGLFRGGLSVSLGGAAPAPAVPPRFPMHTLTVTGTNLAGTPDTGDSVVVFDAGDPAAFGLASQQTNVFYHGTAKYSVPTGTFWAVGEFVTGAQIRLDIVTQVTVTGATHIALSERAATSKLTFVTPRPAATQGFEFTMFRDDRHGPTELGWLVGAGWGLRVSPVSTPVRNGTWQTYTTAQLSSPATAKTQYAYTLNFPGPPGVVPPQRFPVSPGSLATVTEDYAQDVPATGAWITWGGTLAEMHSIGYAGWFVPVSLPGTLVQYVSAQPSTLWQTAFNTDGSQPGGQTDAWRLFHAGEQFTEPWNADPLHVAPNLTMPGAAIPVTVSAARAGDTLVLDVTPFSDSTAGHTGTGFASNPGAPNGPSGSYIVKDNGTSVASGNAVDAAGFTGDLQVRAPLSGTPSTVTVEVDASRPGPGSDLSGSSQDTWTWPSQADPAATVPAPWQCGTAVSSPRQQPDRHCAVQAMIIPEYQVLGLSPAGVTAPGAQTLRLALTYLPGAIESVITQAQLQVSYDGGTTWQDASLSRTGTAGFRASYSAPAASRVSLRVTAQDVTGATVTETATNAYQTGS